MSREIEFLNDFRAEGFGFENGNNMVRLSLVFERNLKAQLFCVEISRKLHYN